MLVYSETKKQFCSDVHDNSIVAKILREMKRRLSRSVGPNEIAAWRNSMGFMERAVRKVPDDANVSIEFMIPLTSKRVDFILAGQGEGGVEKVVIVELKQWSQVDVTSKDAIVQTFVGGANREVGHPSYQAWTYAALIRDYNETVRDDGILLLPCAYLHNLESPDAVNDPFYAEHTKRAPIFISKDAQRLNAFLRQHIRYGDKRTVMYRIESGRIRPSKELADSLLSMLRGNQEFLMIDDQKLVFETAIDISEKDASSKSVLIVEGGPGTGKSVVAINLLVELTKRGLVAQYVSKNAAPRAVYEAMLKGSMKKTEISNLFKGSASFTDISSDIFDTLIVDEAHRLEYRSQYSKNGKNQVFDLVKASKTTIFFLDEDQRVTFKDIGTKEQIINQARLFGVEPQFLTLESQFRCNGSDGYLSWTDNALGIRSTANRTLEGIDYDFRVFDDPAELHNAIREKNRKRNRARVVAGYCWNWASKKDKSAYDIQIGDYRKQWNLEKDGSLWLISPESIEEVGCIHTCQGLELEYVGVIIGPDLVVRNGEVKTDAALRAKQDRSVHGYKKMLKEDREKALEKADSIIKNTYRALMTRGIRGCYIYCTDAETNEYFKQQIGREVHVPPDVAEIVSLSRLEGLPFDLLEEEKERSVPVYDLKAAAGAFSDFQVPEPLAWASLPEGFTVQDGLFICQIVGESMNRRIPNGAWCLFKANPGGTRQGKIVLAQHRDINDPESGGQYTVKRYFSEKSQEEIGSELMSSKITLRPESSDPSFEPISLKVDDSSGTVVLAELIAVL